MNRLQQLFARLLLGAAFAATTLGSASAATRIALVDSQPGAGADPVLDAATALLGKDTELQLVDRAEVGRVLREQQLSLGGVVGAEHAIKAGQLLQAELFAVFEGAPNRGAQAAPGLGLVVFDAKTGVRYADSTVPTSNVLSAASAAAAAVQSAVAKAHQHPGDLHTVGLLTVRNADLPRQLDSLCDSVGLLLERELTASPGLAVLERRRLEQVNKERALVTGPDGNRLLSSLHLMQLQLGQEGAGLRGSLTLPGSEGQPMREITATVPGHDAVALAHRLAVEIAGFLKVPSGGPPAAREAEAARFHREAGLWLAHRDYASALPAEEAAVALAPANWSFGYGLRRLVADYAIELIDPGGQNATGLTAATLTGAQVPTPERVRLSLVLAERVAEKLLEDGRRLAQAPFAPNAGEPWRDLNRYLDKLYRLRPEFTENCRTEMLAVGRKYKAFWFELLEPAWRARVNDTNSFSAYSAALLSSPCNQAYNPIELPGETVSNFCLINERWLTLAEQYAPANTPGARSWLGLGVSAGSFPLPPEASAQMKVCFDGLARHSDPLVQVYGQLGQLVAASRQQRGEIGPALRELQLQVRSLITHAPRTAGTFRAQLYGAIRDTEWFLAGPDAHGERLLSEAASLLDFMLSQQEIQLGIVSDIFSFNGFARYRTESNDRQACLLLERLTRAAGLPETTLFPPERDKVTKELAELQRKFSAVQPAVSVAPALWKSARCLLDVLQNQGGVAFILRPLQQQEALYAVGLGTEGMEGPQFVQLLRIPLTNGSPAYLGKTRLAEEFHWSNSYSAWSEVWEKAGYRCQRRVNFAHAACVGDGYYYLATSQGIFGFPLAGGEPRRLCATNGLPENDVLSLAWFGGKLYAGLPGYLVAWDPVSEQCQTLASSRRSAQRSPFDDQPPFLPMLLAADSQQPRLLMVTALNLDRHPLEGIWSYGPASREFHQLASLHLWVFPTPNYYDHVWAGMLDPNTVAATDVSTTAFLDVRQAQFLCRHVSNALTNDSLGGWNLGIRGVRQFRGPFLRRDDWLWTAHPFQRIAVADGRTEQLPPLRTDYKFEPTEALQWLEDGNRVLAADQHSFWLLELKPQPRLVSATR